MFSNGPLVGLIVGCIPVTVTVFNCMHCYFMFVMGSCTTFPMKYQLHKGNSIDQEYDELLEINNFFGDQSHLVGNKNTKMRL